jgi:hypothetical protein
MTTELGELPSDWRVDRFDSVFDVQQGKQVSKRNRVGTNQRPFLRTKNVFWNRLDLKELDRMHFSQMRKPDLRSDLPTCSYVRAETSGARQCGAARLRIATTRTTCIAPD